MAKLPALAIRLMAARTVAGLAQIIVQPNEIEPTSIANRAIAAFISQQHSYENWQAFSRALDELTRLHVPYDVTLLTDEARESMSLNESTSMTLYRATVEYPSSSGEQTLKYLVRAVGLDAAHKAIESFAARYLGRDKVKSLSIHLKPLCDVGSNETIIESHSFSQLRKLLS